MNIASFVVIAVAVVVVAVLSTYRTKRKHVEPTTARIKCSVSFDSERLNPCNSDSDCSECPTDTCVSVSKEDPYMFHRNGEYLKVPNGKWCLPPKTTDMPCNPLTGDRILTHNGLFKQFTWRCHCKYPWLVRNAGVYGDCEEVTACGKGDLVCPPDSTVCTPGAKWKDTRDWDPKIGVCACPEEQKYVVHDPFKLCENDECFPGKTDGEKCVCPPPEAANGEWFSTVAVGKKCIPDPCNPHGYMHGGRCLCSPGSLATQDALSPTGWICKSPCEPNPCGRKGRCVFDDKGNVQCKDCKFPNYQSEDGMCSNIVKHGNVECNRNVECETRACDTFFAPLWKIGDGKKYCSPY